MSNETRRTARKRLVLENCEDKIGKKPQGENSVKIFKPKLEKPVTRLRNGIELPKKII